jgi:nitronate monooxygenase
MDFGAATEKAPAKAWRDIWSAGQGVGNIDEVTTTATVIARMQAEYETARRRLCDGD